MEMNNEVGSSVIDNLLDSVDYSDSTKNAYTPSNFALNFITFIKLVTGAEGEENTTPLIHLKMLDMLDTDSKRLVNLCFRGSGKTSIFSEYLILYLAIFRKLPYLGLCPCVIFVGDTIEQGVKLLRKNLEARYNNSEFLKAYIPKAHFTEKYIKFTNIEGKVFEVLLYGVLTGIRGTKLNAKRPKLAILDDLLTDKSAKSPTVTNDIKETIYNRIVPALHPTYSKIIFNGTPFNNRDPIIGAIESGAWTVNVFPVCEKFPCEREEFKGAWEERFNYDSIQDAYDTMSKVDKLDAFYQEYMLRISSQENRLVKNNDIGWYNLSHVLVNKKYFNFYITSDFATTESTKSDYNAVFVWAYDFEGNWYWVDGIRKQQTIDITFDDIFDFVTKYSPVSTAIEVSGQQQGFVSLLEREMIARNTFFNLASYNNGDKAGIKPDKSKFLRFNMVVPLFKFGKIKFPLELKSATIIQSIIEEISLVTQDGIKSKKDDCIDNISQLNFLNAIRPAESLNKPEENKFKKARNNIWGNLATEDSSTESTLDRYLV